MQNTLSVQTKTVSYELLDVNGDQVADAFNLAITTDVLGAKTYAYSATLKDKDGKVLREVDESALGSEFGMTIENNDVFYTAKLKADRRIDGNFDGQKDDCAISLLKSSGNPWLGVDVILDVDTPHGAVAAAKAKWQTWYQFVDRTIYSMEADGKHVSAYNTSDND